MVYNSKKINNEKRISYMTNRERTLRIHHYQDVDCLPAVHFGCWPELLQEWAQQGFIPQELAVDNWYTTVGINNGMFPQFEYRELAILPDGSR